MIDVRVDQVLDLSEARTGTNKHGAWLCVNLKEGPNEIGVFAHGHNAEEARRWSTGKVRSINSARRSVRKVGERWFTNVAVDVELIEGPPVLPSADGGEFMEAPPDSLDDLPFN